ncbi:MAG: ThiF family adenylyltransferase [Gammaproteobacteria bacterium]|nr:ThiF family adenylyltransferase [Gammaproteobacteria bacterium]
MNEFDYSKAFSRNIGWITAPEQELLRAKTVAIAGMGGVGGAHLITLTRLGIGSFRLSDLDTFELANFNRQAGASTKTIGSPKVEVMANVALDINPELKLEVFPNGVDATNTASFLTGADLYVDGLDFFAVKARRHVFALCAEKEIPAVTAAPLGMGAALLNFLPGNMSFEEYFQLEGMPEEEQLLRFFVGLAPAGLQQKYLVDPTTIDLAAHKGPSTAMGCELCAGVAATQALKILLGRGKVFAAPHGLQFDAFANKVAHTWRPGGNSHPLHKLALKIGRKRILNQPFQRKHEPEQTRIPGSAVENIIDLARWAPSGDNTQPWRFEILDKDRFLVHGSDTRDWCVYDLDGRASQIAVGALLENISIAATGEGLTTSFVLREDAPEAQPVIEVQLSHGAAAGSAVVTPSPLLPFIKLRVTQRRPLSSRPLRKSDREELEASVGPGYRVVWVEGKEPKRVMARLLFRNAHIRLTIPEAYQVHRRIIEWNAQFSSDRIPDQAIGLDAVNLKSMRWAMQSWKRIVFLNLFFAGTLLPRVMLDLIPGMKCAAHFMIVADQEPDSLQDYLDGGRALQRFWLTATRVGLQFQPEMTPLIFSRFVREGRRFTSDSKAVITAERLKQKLESLIGKEHLDSAVFMGRVGYGNYPVSRSLRLSAGDLVLENRRNK